MLINKLLFRNKKQLGALNEAYLSLFNTKLDAVISSECSGNYKNFLKYNLESRGQFLAHQLHEAMSGIGCDKTLVNEIFCCSTTEDIFVMKEIFERSHDRSLSDTLRKELTGEHEQLIISILINGRGDGPVDNNSAFSSATILKEAFKQRGMMGGLTDPAQRQVNSHKKKIIYLIINIELK